MGKAEAAGDSVIEDEPKEQTEGAEGEKQLDTTPDLAEHMPDLEGVVTIESKAKVMPGRVMLGRKKAFKVELVIPYDGEKCRAINDLSGGYITVSIQREVYKEPQSGAEEEALKQYWLDFGQAVGV